MPNESHDEFLELCAVSTSGQLSQEDQKRLQDHLAVCSGCRKALQQYEKIVDEAIPVMAPDKVLDVDPGPGWSQPRAEKIFLQRLAQEDHRKNTAARSGNGPHTPFNLASPVSSRSTWRHVWMLGTAAILLIATLGLNTHWMSSRNSKLGIQQTQSGKVIETPASLTAQSSLEEQLSDAAHERELLRTAIVQRDEALKDLRAQFEQQKAGIEQMKGAQQRLESDLRNGDAAKQELVGERTDLAQKLQAAQENSQALQQRLASLAAQSTHDTAYAKTLQSKVEDLTKQLQDREGIIDEQQQLLAHDRDIRELIGARDLYIAEVYDVADNGTTKKPYGRVFYDKGRSLIFYAYDLDQQDGLKRATTFQAWGRRGPNRQQALSLGVFSEDDISRKRWVLKFNDSQTLARIDAVFVTVEPNGGSPKPSSKPLLFAYLKTDPNHP
ncbi:MAG TPA: hypothetical protein VN577_11665 [Terriglobales bacterium]|nr:hypothetical protein [Terriglobales bacterium]